MASAEPATNKVFVGNLPFTITNEELKGHFTPFGQVIGVNIRKDRSTGKCKGFGFVSFEEDSGACQSAKDAIQHMHLRDVGGRKLTVSCADKRGAAEADKTPKRPKVKMTDWAGPA